MRHAMFLTLGLILVAPDSRAQVMIDEARLPTPWMTVTADLDQDGLTDRLVSTPHSLDHDIVRLEISSLDAPVFVPIWANRTGEPGITLTSSTTFDLRTGCFACGRYHSEYLWRLAWRDGSLVMAGYRETVVDRLGPRVVECDVNLRTGKAEIHVDGELRLSPSGPVQSVSLADVGKGTRPAQCTGTRAFED